MAHEHGSSVAIDLAFKMRKNGYLTVFQPMGIVLHTKRFPDVGKISPPKMFETEGTAFDSEWTSIIQVRWSSPGKSLCWVFLTFLLMFLMNKIYLIPFCF